MVENPDGGYFVWVHEEEIVQSCYGWLGKHTIGKKALTRDGT
jgi:hypothetical protein